jgi:hypothetical protein
VRVHNYTASSSSSCPLQYRVHENWALWPYMQTTTEGVTSLWIAPSLLLAQYETSAEVTLFLEKDYVVSGQCWI